ncbi:MAG: helix-turn-helix domain-containing protein [Bacteroidota bacterium]
MFKCAWRVRDRGVFLNFLISYIAILILPIVIIGSVVYGRILRQVEDDVRKSNQMMLSQVAQVMDLRIQELGLLAGQVSLNSRVLDFLLRPSEGPDEILKIMGLLKEIGIFQAPNRFISSLNVYSIKADAIVSRQGRYTPAFFYESVAHPIGIDYEQWLVQLKKTHYGSVFAQDYISQEGQLRRYLTYMQSLPTNWGGSAGTMVAYIDSEQVQQLFEPLVADRQGVAFIADAQGNVLISTGEVPPGAWTFPSGLNFTERKIAGKRFVVYSQKSEIMGWNYVSMVPAHIFNARVSSIRGLMLAVLVLCLLVGVGTATILSWRNYRPIQAILEVFKPLRAKSPDRSDELTMILETAQETVRENRYLQAYLKENETLVQGNLLRRLLHGRISATESADAFQTLHLSPNADFAVLVVDVEFFTEKNGEAVLGVMSLAAAEAIRRLISCSITEIDDERLAVLAVLDAEGDKEAAALQLARTIQANLDRDYQIPIGIGLSVSHGTDGIPQAFRQAVQAADYKIVSGRCAITAFNEITQADKSYFYPLDWERQLINHVKVGDFAAVSALVDEVYTENFVRRRLPIGLIRCIFYDLFGTALKVLHELNIAEEEVFGADAGTERWLTQTDTAPEMRERLKQMYGQICAWITGRRESHNTQLKEEILSVLERNYADPNLGLGLLAGQTQVSSSYLCRFFKDQTGYNFADYLNRLRIEKAKKLLHDESLTVGEVATAVGYLSANTFIRIFKKYEGITPGQFREGGGGDAGLAG